MQVIFIDCITEVEICMEKGMMLIDIDAGI